jgi:uncharacterized membrane protein
LEPNLDKLPRANDAAYLHFSNFCYSFFLYASAFHEGGYLFGSTKKLTESCLNHCAYKLLDILLIVPVVAENSYFRLAYEIIEN